MPRLVVIAGPPGVGKSTVSRLLYRKLDRAAWLDGDDLWRMHPTVVDDRTRAMVEDSIRAVLRNLLGGPFDHVIFSWVLHRRDLIERVLEGVGNLPEGIEVFRLACDEAEWRGRFAEGPSPLHVRRFAECAAIGIPAIDTTGRRADEIAEEIASRLR